MIFFTKNPNLKNKKNGGRGGGMGRVGVGGGRWMDSRTGPNQFATSASSQLGAITMQ